MGYVLLAILAVCIVVMFLPQMKGFRTQIFAAMTGMFGAVVPFLSGLVDTLSGLDWRTYVLAGDKKNLTILGIMAAMAVATYILRRATTGPVGTKQ